MIDRQIKGSQLQFQVVSTNENLYGKSYGEWLAAAWNWLLSSNIDEQTGIVYFLRTSSNYKDKGPYCKIGKHRIQVFADQSIFVPVIISLADEKHFPNLFTAELRRADVNNDIDKGDNPPKPYQATINGEPIVDDLKDFRVESPEFLLDVSKDSSVKNDLEVPINTPGGWQAISAGYCVIIKSLPVNSESEPYRLHIGAQGRDNYYTEALYDITVKDRELGQEKTVSSEVSNNYRKTDESLKTMLDAGKITQDDFRNWKDILEKERKNK
jgi:hypothetical protein